VSNLRVGALTASIDPVNAAATAQETAASRLRVMGWTSAGLKRRYRETQEQDRGCEERNIDRGFRIALESNVWVSL